MNKEVKKNKLRFYIFCGIFAIAGLIILVLGAITRANADQISGQPSASLATGTDTLITFGCIVIGITVIGIVGAINEKRFLLIFFTVILAVLMVVEIGMGISVLVQSRNGGSITLTLDIQYPMFFRTYWNDELMSMAIDQIQVGLKCCGVHSPDDFMKLGYGIPGSCCGRLKFDECPPFEIYHDGCLPRLKEVVVRSGNIFGGVCLGLAAFEFIGLSVALLLVNALRKAVQTNRAGHIYSQGPRV